MGPKPSTPIAAEGNNNWVSLNEFIMIKKALAILVGVNDV